MTSNETFGDKKAVAPLRSPGYIACASEATMKQSELKAILKDHRLWLESDGKQGKRADLRCAYLWDANLQGANLQGANLRGANLRGADLQGANLQDAYLRSASLRGASLQGANLRGASFQDAYLQGANLRGADLQGADLDGVYLQGAKFTTNFRKVGWFDCVTFSEDQFPWAVLHPKYPQMAKTLKWVKAEADAA
jgi:uncharacterized protein YjbI with pentapeptide repeats